MHHIVFPPKTIQTTVKLPPSKSISNRALMLNALSLNTRPIENLSDCEDTRVIVDAFNSSSNVFDVKAAGTAMRFLTAFLAGMEGEWEIRGSERMHQRPIHPLVDTLTALGAEITYLEQEGYPPLRIKGRKLKGGTVYLAGNISSQFTSALLMIAPLMEEGLEIYIQNEIVSKPYIHLTLRMMERYGVTSRWEGNHIVVKPQAYEPTHMVVEADWTSASYWYEMVALMPGSQVKLQGLQKDSHQGDANVATLFADLGVKTEYVEDGVVIRQHGKPTKKFFHDFVDEPDLAQTFAATCCLLNVPFLFAGVKNLRIKETDRIAALTSELGKLGYVLHEVDQDMLEWTGEHCQPQESPAIDTYDDHRMAMALAPATMLVPGLQVNHPEVVGKSYPAFWDDLQRAGFTLQTHS